MTITCSLSECPLPHNKDKIDASAKARDARRAAASSTVRYYTDLSANHGDSSSSSSSKTETASQPGILSSSLLEALAISAIDPPPWLAAMNRLGHVPTCNLTTEAVSC